MINKKHQLQVSDVKGKQNTKTTADLIQFNITVKSPRSSTVLHNKIALQQSEQVFTAYHNIGLSTQGRRRRYGRTNNPTDNVWPKLTRSPGVAGQLILSKIIKIVTIRSHILRL